MVSIRHKIILGIGILGIVGGAATIYISRISISADTLPTVTGNEPPVTVLYCTEGQPSYLCNPTLGLYSGQTQADSPGIVMNENSPTPVPTTTASVSPDPDPSPLPSPSPTATSAPTPTPIPTPTPTLSPTPIPTFEPFPTPTPEEEDFPIDNEPDESTTGDGATETVALASPIVASATPKPSTTPAGTTSTQASPSTITSSTPSAPTPTPSTSTQETASNTPGQNTPLLVIGILLLIGASLLTWHTLKHWQDS